MVVAEPRLVLWEERAGAERAAGVAVVALELHRVRTGARNGGDEVMGGTKTSIVRECGFCDDQNGLTPYFRNSKTMSLLGVARLHQRTHVRFPSGDGPNASATASLPPTTRRYESGGNPACGMES